MKRHGYRHLFNVCVRGVANSAHDGPLPVDEALLAHSVARHASALAHDYMLTGLQADETRRLGVACVEGARSPHGEPPRASAPKGPNAVSAAFVGLGFCGPCVVAELWFSHGAWECHRRGAGRGTFKHAVFSIGSMKRIG